MPDEACQLYAVELRSGQWQALFAWYREVLGLRSLVRVDEDSYGLLAAGAARVAVLGGSEPGPASGRVTIAFEVDDLPAAIERLQASGAVTSEVQSNDEGLKHTTTHDPDGNRIWLFSWPQG